ncbi:SUN domain-containing protein 3-like [Rhinatrema bivittatum]|uniref:SUN domain-containing protein 3-like n=1 Tax=Rhinatrema bivittatum TaxID=194408 RepID=UPI001126FD81|nr:SUN domain-containing protein 3-like [Rhinatrema bivittatum]
MSHRTLRTRSAGKKNILVASPQQPPMNRDDSSSHSHGSSSSSSGSNTPRKMSATSSPLSQHQRLSCVDRVMVLLFVIMLHLLEALVRMARWIYRIRGALFVLGVCLSAYCLMTSWDSVVEFSLSAKDDVMGKEEEVQEKIQTCRVNVELVRQKNNEMFQYIHQIVPVQKQLAELQAEVRSLMEDVKETAQQAITETMQKLWATKAVTGQKALHKLRTALQQLQEDHVQVADYALKSVGAQIVQKGNKTTWSDAINHFFIIPERTSASNPDVILQPNVHPGNCWAFPGSQGQVVIRLPLKIHPVAVTLEHIPKAISPTGDITDAPRDFAVYGLEEKDEAHGALLGTFTYNADADPVQTFRLRGEADTLYQFIELKVLSNWGNQASTCLYRFRVHKDLPSSVQTVRE